MICGTHSDIEHYPVEEHSHVFGCVVGRSYCLQWGVIQTPSADLDWRCGNVDPETERFLDRPDGDSPSEAARSVR